MTLFKDSESNRIFGLKNRFIICIFNDMYKQEFIKLNNHV